MPQAPLSFPIKLAHSSGNREPGLVTARRLSMSLWQSADSIIPMSQSASPDVLHHPPKYSIKLSIHYWMSCRLHGLLKHLFSSMLFQRLLITTLRPDLYGLGSGENSPRTRPHSKSILVRSGSESVIVPSFDSSSGTIDLGKNSLAPNYRKPWKPGIAHFLWT